MVTGDLNPFFGYDWNGGISSSNWGSGTPMVNRCFFALRGVVCVSYIHARDGELFRRPQMSPTGLEVAQMQNSELRDSYSDRISTLSNQTYN